MSFYTAITALKRKSYQQSMPMNSTTCIKNSTLSLNHTGTNITCSQMQRKYGTLIGPSMPVEARIFLICLYAIIFLLGVTGNTVVCYVIGNFHIKSKMTTDFR